jgi:hypothetical protein
VEVMSPRVEVFVNKSGNVLHRPRTWIGPNLHRIAMSDTCDVIQLLRHVVWESHHRHVITSHLTLGRSAVNLKDKRIGTGYPWVEILSALSGAGIFVTLN